MWPRKEWSYKKDVVKKMCGQEKVWSRKGVKDVVKKWCGQEKDVVIKKDVHKAKE